MQEPHFVYHRPDPFAAARFAEKTSWVADPITNVGPHPVVEVIVSFGHSVLKVAVVDPEAGFSLGAARDPKSPMDLEVAPELIGFQSFSLLHLDEGGSVFARLPEQVQGTLSWENKQVALSELRPTATRAPGQEDAFLQRLGRDLVVEYELGALHIKLQLGPRPQALPTGWLSKWEREVPMYFAACSTVFVGLIASAAYFSPPLGLSDESKIDRERLFLISQYLDAASEREEEAVEREFNEQGSDGGSEGKRAEETEGEAGKPQLKPAQKQVAVRGPRDNPELTLSRSEALAEARTGGMIELLSGAANEAGIENSLFGRDRSLGNMDVTAQGKLWANEIGDAGGMGGLGISGTGFGGGALFGSGAGMGMSYVGTIGTGTGHTGFGIGHGRPSGTHESSGPRLRTRGNTEVSGHLPPQVIQRVVRQNFGRFRLCYEQGLARNPNLEGRVSVRFVIGNDGAVSTVSAGGDLPDQGAKSCVATAFYGLSFPSPKDGIVRVTYPLMFSPE